MGLNSSLVEGPDEVVEFGAWGLGLGWEVLAVGGSGLCISDVFRSSKNKYIRCYILGSI